MEQQWAHEVRRRAESFWQAERRAHLLGAKKLLLDPVADAPLLRVMGLCQRDGSMNAFGIRKFMQVNQLVALLEPMFHDLMKTAPVIRVLDAGCGRSYLTLLVAWCFAHRYRHPAEVLGIDRQELLAQKCAKRAALLPFETSLHFAATPLLGADLAALWQQHFHHSDAPVVHVVLALHACDTATDDVLALAIGAQAPLVGVVPCCHAELSAAWGALADSTTQSSLRPLWLSPHLRREAAASLTDLQRLLLLRRHGYRATALESVPSEHTPKNTLLRAVYEGASPAAKLAASEFSALRELCGVGPLALERQLDTLKARPL